MRICDGYEKMDFDKVAEMLSKAYWSEGIEKDEVMKGAANSALVVGVFMDNEQIGYGRAISDKTRIAYISDVYIDENFRNQGIGQRLVEYILTHESLKDVYQWMLATRDAHSVFANFGFQPIARPEGLLALRRERSDAPRPRLI